MAIAEIGTTIAIRPLSRRDVASVRRLERTAYGASNPRTPFERELRNGLARYLVAVAQGDAAGSDTLAVADESSGGSGRTQQTGLRNLLRRLFGAPEQEEPILGFAGVWYTHEQLHLVTIAVEPARQGAGIGQALLLAICDLAVEAELDSIALEVRASNPRALRLYEHFGFRRSGRLSAYYSDNGEDAIVMLLDGLAGPAQPPALASARAAHERQHGGRFATLIEG